MTSRLVSLLGADQVAGSTARELADRIRALVLDGRLTVGEKLPSERAQALEIRRSRSTTTRVYGLLEDEGYVSRVHGGGTRISLPRDTWTPRDADDHDAIDLSIASMDSTPGLYDATVRSLPRLAALRGTSGYSLRGLPELRDAVAQRFSQRGLPTDADQIIITSGALNGLNLVLAAIGRRGERALVEQPTFPHALEALHRHGYRMLPTPVDVEGWDERHVTETILSGRPHVAYLIPDFHNPTGATLPDSARERIAATARSAGTMLIVDETTAELDIDRGWAPLPFAASSPEVVTLGSMSKIAWGGLRLGWIRADRSLISRLLATRPSFELGTALLEQCIAVELLQDMPALTAHVRTRLCDGRAAVAAGLDEIDGVTMPSAPGGLSVWLDLGAPVSTELSLAARERGLILPPGPRFATGGVLERHVRVPITLPPDRTTLAMQRFRSAWEAVTAGRAPRLTEMSHAAVI